MADSMLLQQLLKTVHRPSIIDLLFATQERHSNLWSHVVASYTTYIEERHVEPVRLVRAVEQYDVGVILQKLDRTGMSKEDSCHSIWDVGIGIESIKPPQLLKRIVQSLHCS